ncbi:MAG TPA: hypothetical protein VIR56_06440 [Solimonas sp.]
MTETHRLPPDLGAVSHPTQKCVVIYRLVDEWSEQYQDYQSGGVIRMPIKTGRKTYEAHPLGDPTLLELTPELRAEIERDIAKRGIQP